MPAGYTSRILALRLCTTALTKVGPIFVTSLSHLFSSPLTMVELPVEAFGKLGAYGGPNDIGAPQMAIKFDPLRQIIGDKALVLTSWGQTTEN